MKKQDAGCRMQDAETNNKAPHQVLHPASRILDPVSLQRIRWRARRGLLELDIVLGRFIESHYEQLDEAEKQAFEALLDMPDNPLWDMIAGRAAPDEQQALLEKIRAA